MFRAPGGEGDDAVSSNTQILHAPSWKFTGGFMKCPECLGVNANEATKCKSCGYRFTVQEASPETHEDLVGRYFGFRKLITPALVKLSYLLGALGITLICIFAIASPDIFTTHGEDSTRTRYMGILALIFGNLAWRMLCEGAILLFSLHEILVSLEDKADFLATHYEQRTLNEGDKAY
jgi:hypothetical protein